MTCRCLIASVAMALAALPATAAPLLLESFESFNDGDAITAGGLPATFATTSVGVTEGSVAAQSTLFGSGYQKIADVNLNVTLPDSSIAAGKRVTSFSLDAVSNIDSSSFTQIVAGIFFGSDGSFEQIDGFKAGGTDSFVGLGETTTTIIYDENGSNFNFGTGVSTPVLPVFDKINSDLANGDFVGLGIYVNNGGAVGTVAVDNITGTVIPEPASLALMGLLAASLAARPRA